MNYEVDPLLMSEVEVLYIAIFVESWAEIVCRYTRNGAFISISLQLAQYFNTRSSRLKSELELPSGRLWVISASKM